MLTVYVMVKFTKHQIETFLKYFNKYIDEWYLEAPKGQERRDVKTLERVFQKLENSIGR